MQKDYTFIQEFVNEHKENEKNWLLARFSDICSLKNIYMDSHFHEKNLPGIFRKYTYNYGY